MQCWGTGEQRTEPYMKYGEGVVETVTQQYAKSTRQNPALLGWASVVQNARKHM
jgi:hypothetical protein